MALATCRPGRLLRVGRSQLSTGRRSGTSSYRQPPVQHAGHSGVTEHPCWARRSFETEYDVYAWDDYVVDEDDEGEEEDSSSADENGDRLGDGA
jgi:hypothetical protein